MMPTDMGNLPSELRKHLAVLGKKGGRARKKNLSKKELSQIGKKAARARWRNK
jgi:hypothetical protein